MLRLGFASTHQAILSTFVVMFSPPPSLSSHCCNVTPRIILVLLLLAKLLATDNRSLSCSAVRTFSSSFEFRSQRVSRWSDAKKKKKKVVAIHGARRCVASTGGTAQDISGQDKEIPQAPCQLGRFASPGCRKWQGASINFECFMLTRADNVMVNDAPLYRTVRTRGSIESRISIRFQTGMETQHLSRAVF
jgi:hypothetical protein